MAFLEEGPTMIKTVLDLDLMGYSSVARIYEQGSSAESVAGLNAQIQGFVDQGLAAVGLAREQTVMATTGDGAILVFDRAADAHRFAEALYRAARQHNAPLTEPTAKRWFRVGAATGDITMKPRPGGGYDIAGVTIANAVRLEAAAHPGELLIDAATYDALPAELRLKYQAEEQVPGKRDETFQARRYMIVPQAASEAPAPAPPKPKAAPGNPKVILELFHKLYPEALLEELIFLLEMPSDQQPARAIPYDQRRNQVLMWAASPAGPGRERLESELRYLLESKENPPPAHR
jgi:hypothetical protein